MDGDENAKRKSEAEPVDFPCHSTPLKGATPS